MRSLLRERSPRIDPDALVHEARRVVAEAREAEADALRRARRAEALAEARSDELARAEERARQVEAELVALRRAASAPRPEAREAVELTATALSDVLDGLVRSLGNHPDPEDPWFRGNLALIARTRTALGRLGVQTVGAPGERFDPTAHDAVGVLSGPDLKPGTLAEVIRQGLRLADGTLLRPATVVVAEEAA